MTPLTTGTVWMLWFDNDPKTIIPEKILRASRYFYNKYGVKPTATILNPIHTQKKGPETKILPTETEINIHTAPFILPNHFWIGPIPPRRSP